MATLLFVSPPDRAPSPPPEFGLLSHTLTTAVGTDGALTGSADADLVLLDARQDLPWAKQACQSFATTRLVVPILLLVRESALPVLSPEWGLLDFLLEGAQAAEIDARVRLALVVAAQSTTIHGGPVEIDEAGYSATLDGVPLDLTYTEFELLKFLVINPGRVLTREHLLSEVWGYDYYGGTRTVDVHIRRLRAKLGAHDQCISTVRNVGYRFSVR